MEHTPRASEQFSTPQEEISYLKEKIAQKERELLERTPEASVEHIARQEVAAYAERKPHEVLHPKNIVPTQEMEAIVLDLAPEAHDDKMNELLGILRDKGIHATLAIVEKMNDPHVADDFHRLLVQYIRAGFSAGGLSEKDPVWKALHMTLFEILVPEAASAEKGGPAKPLKELLSSMEQFYSGMMALGGAKGAGTFSFEIAVANHSDDFVFYCSVPDAKCALFEKQILSIFPDAKVSERTDDYNIFNEQGATAASRARLAKNHIFPLKTYEKFDFDPINALLNSFSKIAMDGEGASIQIVCNPVGDFYSSKYRSALEKIQKGDKLSDAIDIAYTTGDKVFRSVVKGIDGLFKSEKKERKEADENDSQKGMRPENEIAAEEIKAKIAAPVLAATLRIVASAPSAAEAEAILSDLEASFNQFENTQGNRLVWDRIAPKGLIKELERFTYRQFDEAHACPLSLRELATIMHLPVAGRVSTSQVKSVKAGSAPAPLGLPQEGTLLGLNADRGRETWAYMTDEDRLRHLYVIGQTGTGKTTLLKAMAFQDIERGAGMCFIDPHGSDIEDILALIPKNRLDDVIYFDPAYTARPMALNMLEYDPRYPEQKTFVVNEMLSIFNKLFDMKTAGGPMFEQYFRNAVLLTIDDPASGATLVDVSRVLSNKAYRQAKIASCKNPLVVQFWKEVAEKAGGEASLANIVPYIVSKFDNFLANDIMRPVVSQQKSSFNFRDIMDNKKILLVNLSKGRLGDINANLIGLIVVGKILMAALSRVDSLGSKDIAPFYLYIDEFQNVTTDSIATILSEARKYKLSLTVAHQFVKQLDDKTRNAVFGNVGSMAVYRVGAEDAEFFTKQFEPVFAARDLMNVDNYRCYVKLLAKGQPVKPFDIRVPKPPHGDRILAGKIKELSYLTYGKDRSTIEREISSYFTNPTS